ncbi:hypothetical protein XELAEV_18039915mg [Xenopus laevis]|uniref:Uncharacterized protein n=1 Tax=Xenopus laevis TaxID=8355 RepID=A0A974H8F1_XENLA|nr:hypothetical protein XELAEV_18039915mg [Xenopus laevis]
MPYAVQQVHKRIKKGGGNVKGKYSSTICAYFINTYYYMWQNTSHLPPTKMYKDIVRTFVFSLFHQVHGRPLIGARGSTCPPRLVIKDIFLPGGMQRLCIPELRCRCRPGLLFISLQGSALALLFCPAISSTILACSDWFM